MENYQFPSTYTAISGLLDDVDNSKQWNFELWHYCIKATLCLQAIWYTEKKKISHFDPKSWVTWGTKIRPSKVGNWRIFESNWLNIKSQIDSALRVKLTQHWESNWLNIESQTDSTLRVKLTQHWESNWLNIESQIGSTMSQIGSTMRVKFTQIFSNLPGRIIISPVTQLLRSKWLNFFSRFRERKNWVIWTKKFGSNFSSASDSTFQI